MFIAGLGTAVPRWRYSQAQCWEAVQAAAQWQGLAPRSRAILKKVLTGSSGIVTRHLSLPELTHAFDLDADALHRRFLHYGPELATTAAERALRSAGTRSSEVDAMIISTCTGYLCPGLTSYVSERLGLRPEVLALDLVGQGCGAAVPNLRAGEALLKAGRCRRVLCICVEICSAAFYLDDNPGVLISACLFGDGAGAAVLADEPAGRRQIAWRDSGSLLQPEQRDLLRFEQKGGMLRNLLAPQVPQVAARQVAVLLARMLAGAQIDRSKIQGWILHPGGRDVLLALRRELGLDEEDLRWSAAVLREFGNVSSASVFFVLERALADSAPEGCWWLCSFGAGFSCHGVLLEVK